MTRGDEENSGFFARRKEAAAVREELAAAIDSGAIEASCQLNWLTGDGRAEGERCPGAAARLVRIPTAAGALVLGVCDRHAHAADYLTYSADELHDLDFRVVVGAFRGEKRQLAIAQLGQQLGRPEGWYTSYCDEQDALDRQRAAERQVEHKQHPERDSHSHAYRPGSHGDI
jgi:hypothetical protein